MANKLTKSQSVSDQGQIFKDVHERDGNALRVYDCNSQVPAGYTRATFETNVDGSVTKAVFYRGTTSQVTEIKCLPASSLNNKYFYINTAEDEVKYYVWFNINGLGVDPAVPNRMAIEVMLNSTDSADIVAYALNYIFNAMDAFKSVIMRPSTQVIHVENLQFGLTTDAIDISTGFEINTLTEGLTEKVSTLVLPYDGNNRYIFNYATKQFELLQKTITGELSPSGLRIAGKITEVELVDYEWRLLPPAALSNRNALAVQNPTGTEIKLNYTNAVIGYVGMVIYPNGGERRYDIKDTIPAYGRSQAGTVIVNVEELS
jgi:hypothetical protein